MSSASRSVECKLQLKFKLMTAAATVASAHAKRRGENSMPAKKSSSRSGKAKSKVHKVMKEHKEGSLRSGSGKKVKAESKPLPLP